MKSKWVQGLLRALITLVGAGVGAAATLAGMQLFRYTHPSGTLPMVRVVMFYVGASLAGALIFFLLSNGILRIVNKVQGELLNRLDRMPAGQLLTSVVAMILGLVVAALLSQILGFMGDSIFTTAISAILFLVFGALGYTIGWRRHADFVRFFMHLNGFKGHRFTRKKGRKARSAAQAGTVPVKVLDTSVLIDGRVAEVCRLGFLEGEIVVPEFVLAELRHIADAADTQRRVRGRRGLDVVQRLQDMGRPSVRIDATDYADTQDVDVKLLRLARALGGVLVTGDYNLSKVAAVTGMRVMNLNELAGVLRPVVRAGDEMTVAVVKEGKEAGQGVAYMDDGTMIVVDGGRACVGEEIAVVVTSALQTNAGRMIFAKRKD